MKKYIILAIIFTVSQIFYSGFIKTAFAAACNSGNLFLASQALIGWGDTPNNAAWSQVQTTPNSTVRLSVSGEDGCTGRQVTFQVLRSSSVIRTFSGNLILGRQLVSGNPTTFQLYYDWTNDLPLGQYRFRTTLPLQAGPSFNILNVQQITGPCLLSQVNTTPPLGTAYGTPIQINVAAQGTCQNWGVTVNIYETTGNQNTFIPPTLAEQRFPAGSNQLTFSWNPVRNPGAGLQATYRADAILGSQTLSSNGFIVSGTSTTPPTPGQDQTVFYNLINPLRGGSRNILDVALLISNWIFNVAITIATILIIYGGVRFLVSRGIPGEVEKAKNILWYAVLGLTIILIGKGFIALIESVLNRP